jgi:hypothetical protein
MCLSLSPLSRVDRERERVSRERSVAWRAFSLGVGFKKIFDSKFDNFSVFRIFLHSKIVSNSNRIFLDVRRAYVEPRTFLLT